MIKASVLGATGYAGVELVRILSKHPAVSFSHLASRSYAGKALSEVYPNFKNVVSLELCELDPVAAANDSDIVFTALPHGASKEVIPLLADKKVKIIDFSGDFRYKSREVYEKWYGEPHSAPELLEKSVYGLCELHRDEIAKASLVGNPGCYTTCSILALAPLVDKEIIHTDNIIIDAKSGVTGAGRSSSTDYSFCECDGNMKAYKIATHRHTSEIEQELSLIAKEEITLSFTPHLIPIKRGILSTCYANLNGEYTDGEIIDVFKDYYKGEYFVRICDKGVLPEVKNVAGSNFVDIGLCVDRRLGRVVVVSCIDNIVKGAAGQAVQNMNIMFGLPESMGIDNAAFYL
ncbi:MAG: N-acetyl-gamma-glutamyl-phosphate reductase [Firmicutes bacterium ADurb.Bin193]|nr:MAG: N-acetyl-gamma-glutamyl-phosphate reductase [Firmicutes bacterium ADurb.Bin193]